MNKNILKGLIIVLILMSVGLGICCCLVNNNRDTKDNNSNTLKELPKPELDGGQRGELGIDKNINETNIDEYLNREDSVYRDMRMLEDPAIYENIGGDRFLSGYIKGFEIVPLPYIIPVDGLPSEVGNTYIGTTLFSYENNTYVANYEESMSIIEELFPKDKIIFLMCGGGGYAGMTKNFLVQLGWDENKIYNIGGYWYYKGKNNIEVKKTVDGKVTYDFENVPYHKIEFDKLTKIEKKIPVTGIKISTSKQTVEIGQTYQLNAIVMPNEATNKNVKWTSSNSKIATVDSKGLVTAKSAGTTKINAVTEEGNKTVSCTITVPKKEESNYVVLSDISSERKEFDAISSYTLREKFESKVYDKDYNLIVSEAEFEKESKLYDAEIEKYEPLKIKILDNLLDSKKTFILLIELPRCGMNNSLNKFETAEKILDKNNINYISLSYASNDGLYESKIYKLFGKDEEKLNSVSIIKDGKLYVYIDESKTSFKTESDLKKWLSKYIKLK